MLEADNLSCSRGQRTLFSGISFAVKPGGLLSVLGANGSGKSSLLRLLSGLLSPESGRIIWQGQDITTLKERYVAQLTYIGHLNGIKDDLTPVENLRMFSRFAGREMSAASAGEALEAVGLRRCGDLPTRVLSQGQKRLVALARLWMSEVPLWLLDEPFTSLDTCAGGLLAERVATHLNGGGMAVVTAHQEVGVVAESVHQIRLAG